MSEPTSKDLTQEDPTTPELQASDPARRGAELAAAVRAFLEGIDDDGLLHLDDVAELRAAYATWEAGQ